MTVESASYISGLNVLWPLDSDSKSEGDNHLRIIKSALKTSFPNINGAVSVTDEELNYLSGVASNIQTQINDMSATISALTTQIANLSSTFNTRASTLSAAFTTVAGNLSSTFNTRAGTLSAAFTTRADNLSATLTTLSQSISALNTMVASRPVYGAAVYQAANLVLSGTASRTIPFNAKYFDTNSIFDSANYRLVAPANTKFARISGRVAVSGANMFSGYNGRVTVSICRGGSAISTNVISAVSGQLYANVFMQTPFISASVNDSFCMVATNEISSSYNIQVGGISPSEAGAGTMEGEFITWS